MPGVTPFCFIIPEQSLCVLNNISDKKKNTHIDKFCVWWQESKGEETEKLAICLITLNVPLFPAEASSLYNVIV